jgi:dTDP-glucose 4,6-dehydratase
MGAIVLTGATGFAGRCVVKELEKRKHGPIISLQRKLESVHGQFCPYVWDFCKPMEEKMSRLLEDVEVDYFLHLGSSVHALRSLENPMEFVENNIVGTANVLEVARRMKHLGLFVYMSTAEVLGGRDEGYSLEDDPLLPSNPYSATKAAGELLTMSYHKAFRLPAITVRTMNIIGKDQTDESKFVPMVKKSLLSGETLKIHARNGKPGMRQWIDVGSFTNQFLDLLPSAEPGQTYHIVGEELSNIEIAQRVADEMGIPLKFELIRMPPTHEFRYGLQRTK